MEYQLNLNEQDRHELATVVIDRGTLYTFAVGTNEDRWNKVDGGPEIIYHDLINSNETLSLVVSDVNKEVDLEQLGSPIEVGQTLIDKVIAPEGSGRSVKLVNANKREASNHIFYDLEYQLNLNEQDRHELATVVIDRGTLYTFAVGTNEDRWNKVDRMFTNVIESFNFLI